MYPVNDLCALSDVRVLEAGTRTGVSIGASLLRDAGASVSAADLSDAVAVRTALANTQIVLTSSDVDPAWIADAIAERMRENPQLIAIDITGAGSFGPLAGIALTDLQVQAMCGLIDSTGNKGEPPAAIGFPVVEVSAGIYGAIAAVVALISRDRDGAGQRAEIALYDCAVNALTTFLPKAFAGGTASRIGNRHPLGAPWNAYPTRDGWVLVCAVSDDQWTRLSGLIDPNLAADTRFVTVADRVGNVDDLDAIVSAWSSAHDTQEFLALCEGNGIPCGPIVSVDALALDPNVRHRKMIRADSQTDPSSQSESRKPGVPFKIGVGPAMPGPRAARHPSDDQTPGYPGHLPPLRGLHVVEVGQYTTAPLVAKHLAALGAAVVKVEPEEGDATRFWKPGQGDMGYFFAMTNTDKSVVTVDLRTAVGRSQFSALLRRADVLVENMKPGALSRLLGAERAPCVLNPALVHCAISGFGLDSAYPGRPAFDTIAQAMSGMMDMTRAGGVPTKAGISAADILGGQVALFTILCTLRDIAAASHAGAEIDLAMQDVGVWATYPASSGKVRANAHLIVACKDADYIVEGKAVALDAWVRTAGLTPAHGSVTTSESMADLRHQAPLHDLTATSIRPITDVLNQPQFLARCLTSGRDAQGTFWPLIHAPYRMQRTPAVSQRIPGALGADNASVFANMNDAANLP